MHRVNRQNATQMRSNPYPPLDSISSSLDQEAYRYEIPKEKNYKPLLALNIDIGDDVPVRVLVYHFTDSWKRAYEFIKEHDLPEEMHEDIAMLISNAKEAKEKELHMQKLAAEKQGSFAGGAKAHYHQRQEQIGRTKEYQSRRGASCELRSSNSTNMHSGVGAIVQPKDNTRRVLFEQFEEPVPFSPTPTPTLVRINSSGDYKQSSLFGSDPNHFQKPIITKLEKEGQLPLYGGLKDLIGEKSTVLDSTTLLSNNSEKDKSQSTNMKASPFESRIGEVSVLSSSNVNVQQTWSISGGVFGGVSATGHTCTIMAETLTTLTTSNRPSDNRGSTTATCSSQDLSPFPQPPKLSSSENEQKVLELFKRLDYDYLGVIRSFDVYLSNLTSETKNQIHSILSQYDRPNGFRSFSLDAFRAVLLQSPLFPCLSLDPAQH